MQPTQALLKRPYRKLRLTTKDANKGFYKGTRTGSMGWHTKFGTYVIDWNKVRTFVVPEGLADSKLTPFVTQKIDRTYGDYTQQGPLGPRSPEAYLENWKAKNGYD